MDAEIAIATPMVNPLTSPLSDTVELVVEQEQKGLLMHYPAEVVQIGQQITKIILTTPEPKTLLAKIAKALGEVFRVDACLIVAGVNPVATNPIALWCAPHYPAQSPSNQAQRLKHPTPKDDLADVQPLAIPDLQASDTCKSLDWLREVLPARAVMRIYTRFQSSVNGVIVLAQSQPRQWTTQEQELLSGVSESVAIAISQLQLTRQVVAATRHQTLLNQLSRAMQSALTLDEILKMAIAGTAETLQVERGLLLLLNYTKPLFNHLPKTEVTVACEWLGESAGQSAQATGRVKTLLNQSFWLEESSLCQQAFRNAPEPLVIAEQRDAPTDEVAYENISIFEREMMPALLMVPLVGAQSNAPLAGTMLGFLVLQHPQPRPWHTDEIELVKWVSTQVSATIIQNQTLRQVQALVEERTAQLQQSLEAQGKLYQTTRQQMEQLQQLNQLKDEFTSTMSHELRTPLTTMSLAIRMLRQPTLPSQRREKYLEILEQQCHREIELINDLLDLQRLESDQSQIQLQKIDLMLLIKELAQSFEQKWADKRLTLTVETPERSLLLNTDPDSLNRILLELLTNAGKYSDPDTIVCLKVTHQVQQSENQVVLTLTNTGPGISPTDLTHIFEKFRRGQGVTQQAVQGTGLGLALVKCLVHNLNGTIDVESCPSENSQTFFTSFTLTLPQRVEA